MANREKKLTLARKQINSSPILSTENSENPLNVNLTIAENESTLVVKPTKKKTTKNPSLVAGKLKKKPVKKNVGKKSLAISFKPKAKKTTKINRKIAKALLNSVKKLECNKKVAVLGNGIKPSKKRKAVVKKVNTVTTQGDIDDTPPILEPILPLDESTIRKQTKRTNKKTPVLQNEEEVAVASNQDGAEQDASNKMELIVKPAKKTRTKKIKSEPLPEIKTESLEDVINDLTYLISSNDIKTEPVEPVEEFVPVPVKNTKRTITRKSKLELFKKRLEKQENIENILSNKIPIDKSANHLIDMLDLNVTKIKDSPPREKRRHSIEKFPLSYENNDNSSFTFGSLPSRCRSPKVKRTSSKSRQSCDITPLKRASPYSTRSDSPARRILRNGKQRQLKDGLLEGLDPEYKRRRRLCSDYSGSEKSVSKISGYDSDSSFSDLASLVGNETVDVKDTVNAETPNKLETRKEEETSPSNVTSTKTAISTTAVGTSEVAQNIDTNSNVFQQVKVENLLDKTSQQFFENPNDSGLYTNSDTDVPEKDVILDIMKQKFNDVKSEEQEKRTTRSSMRKTEKLSVEKEEPSCLSTVSFYGIKDSLKTEDICKKESDINNVEENSKTSEDLLLFEKIEVDEENNGNSIIACETTAAGIFNQDLKQINTDDIIKVDSEESFKSNDSSNISDTISDVKVEKICVEETPENLAIKENILHALGLQSLKEAEEAKQRVKEKTVLKQDYTGTLKTVIKLNRYEKKKSRSSLKMTLHKSKTKGKDGEQQIYVYDEDFAQKSNVKEGMAGWRSTTSGGHTSDTGGAIRKSHYSNRSNLDGSSEHTSDGDTGATEGDDSGKILVIPEKASSFSIHPGRLCKDECSYCFGKFGLFDTPCHIAQMKTVERQDRILSTEKHLTRDSCLCDACYRHVDRKSNTPSYSNKCSKRNSMVAPGPRQNYCHVLGCKTIASNILRRKWIIKMRKNVCQVINIDLDNPGLHSIPICEDHFAALEHLMVCAMCKRRLARNHIHYLGPEVNDLNMALLAEGIPIKLSDKPIVCKLCRYFSTLILKSQSERPENSTDFFKDYKKRLLHFNDLEVMEETVTEQQIAAPSEDKCDKSQVKKKKRIPKSKAATGVLASVDDAQTVESEENKKQNRQCRVPSESTSSSNDKSRSESPTEYMVDYNTLVPSIAMECGSDGESSLKKEPPLRNPFSLRRISRPETVKEAVEISKNMKLSTNICNIKSTVSSANAVHRLGTNPSISVRQLFPGEEEMSLQANIDFNNVRERTPEGWEKCISTIQYDLETKQLWQDLQKPYGNLSSFLRHLILLEKYYRNGDLVLSANATSHSINYSESVQNRLRAYDNLPTNTVNQINPSVILNVKKSSSGIITTKEPPISHTITHTINAANIPKNTPITFSQISSLSTSSSTLPSTTTTSTATKQKNPGLPPGLISLHPGTIRPIAPLIKVPQSQKIKIPLTKNWRPNLIPIDPNKKQEKDKKMEYVKVISAGKPYHITLEDYHRICAIKRSCDLKQKRLQEAAKNAGNSILKAVYNKKNITKEKSNKNEPLSPESQQQQEIENSLKKLDETVEKLESKFSATETKVAATSLPKIPKSLTVIPQGISQRKSSAATHNLNKSKNVSTKVTTLPSSS